MKIKIKLDKDQTPEDADNRLYKAMSMHASGDAHEDEFDDPVMQEFIKTLSDKFQSMLRETMDEIHDELDLEHNDDYF